MHDINKSRVYGNGGDNELYFIGVLEVIKSGEVGYFKYSILIHDIKGSEVRAISPGTRRRRRRRDGERLRAPRLPRRSGFLE